MPYWFALTGLAVSGYHGYRGYVLQRWTAQTQRREKEQAARSNNTDFAWFMSPRETVVVRYVYDGLLYFFCSIVGFVALWLAISIFDTLPNVHDIPGGTGALLAFLSVLGLVGISGMLPYVIQLGKLPR